jgi:hypothetical protein
MRMGDENVIRLRDIVDVEVFGQDARAFQPRVQEDGEAAGLQSESRGACMGQQRKWVKSLWDLATLQQKTYRTTRSL